MRNFNDYINLLKKWLEKNEYTLLNLDRVYRLNLSYDSYPEYCSLEWIAKCVVRKINEKCFDMFGFKLNEIDNITALTPKDITSLLKSKSLNVEDYDLVTCQMLVEELLLENLLIQQYMLVPDRLAIKYIKGQVSDQEMKNLVTAIRKVYAILEDEGYRENEARIRDAAIIWQNAAKEYKSQAVIEFQTENTDITENDLHTILNTKVSYLDNKAIEFVPVNKRKRNSCI